MVGEEIGFESGGERLAGRAFRPTGAERPLPCVVLGSGLSCVRDQGLDAFAERLVAAGFAALAFDYRSFGESGGDPRGVAAFSGQRDDFRAAVAFARSLSWVDGERVVLWGFSLGGGHVQALAASEPEIAAAVCVAPVVDSVRSLLNMGSPFHLLGLLAKGARDRLRALRGAEPLRVPAAGPPGSAAVLSTTDSPPGFAAITPPGSTWRNELCARAVFAPPYRLLPRAGRIRCPILFCIADDDDVNPPALGVEAAERAPRGELRRYPGGHYDPFLGETLERMAADQVEFLARHLSAAG